MIQFCYQSRISARKNEQCGIKLNTKSCMCQIKDLYIRANISLDLNGEIIKIRQDNDVLDAACRFSLYFSESRVIRKKKSKNKISF